MLDESQTLGFQMPFVSLLHKGLTWHSRPSSVSPNLPFPGLLSSFPTPKLYSSQTGQLVSQINFSTFLPLIIPSHHRVTTCLSLPRAVWGFPLKGPCPREPPRARHTCSTGQPAIPSAGVGLPLCIFAWTNPSKSCQIPSSR